MDTATAELLRTMLLAEIQVEDELLLKVVDAIPEANLTWKPGHPKSMRANELAHHAVAAASFFLRSIDGTDESTATMVKAPATPLELRHGIVEIQKQFRESLAGYTAEQLAAEYDFFGDTIPGIDMLRWHKRHLIHHRAQLALYLRLMGASVPGTYGPSADDMEV